MGVRGEYAVAWTTDTFDVFIILVVGIHTYLFLGATLPLKYWTSALLQIAAVLLGRLFTKLQAYNAATYAFLILITLVSSTVLVMASYVYQKMHDVSLHKLNLILFSCSLAGYCVLSVLLPKNHGPSPPAYPRDVFASGVLILLRVAEDILAIAVLRRTSAFTFSALRLLSTALIAPISFLFFKTAIGFSFVQWMSSILAIYAAASYFLDAPAPSNAPSKTPTSLWPRPSKFALLGLSFIPPLVLLLSYPLSPIPHSPPFVWEGSNLGTAPPLPHKLLPTVNSTSCQRNPLPPSSAYPGPGARPEGFHTFDDVLLVVFFSHPRYDMNLDGYREVYSRYFPNILFIGPASREDMGFLHSYDVAIDSYMSDDDYGIGWYKMAGRAAHHMFYTAVKDHPCYAGYLWAPFDALLNVPRLAQFPQDKIWYHSPFTDHYVPNPAVPANATMHAPAAMVMEKTASEYVAEVEQWGSGWHGWWGELHVGLKVCMPAFRELPLRMRQRLETLSGAPERLIGGSADTMYFPSRLRDDFLDVVGTFLMTSCFLEIVLPTTMHLILPEGEDIVFVDHWWMNDPPFNTTFIRQKWEEGFEVDTFHTFHWGDIQKDGFFGPNVDSVKDVRLLLQDSFRRQKMDASVGGGIPEV
ncbi:hypothetical protein C8J57DRAFT_671921 [Mycena rebaudengoi]|nr:hypothetical protein C8J57DRAFT_671921 [Mycena rebaudengoi]